MTRNQHLSYCSVCKNRRFTLKQGFICGLTDKIADFEESCKDFKLDKDEKRKQIDKIVDRIKEDIKEDGGGLKHLVDTAMTIDEYNISEEAILVKPSKIGKISFLVSGIILILVGFWLLSTILLNNLENTNTILFIFYLVFTVPEVYLGIICIIRAFRDDTAFKIDKSGITNAIDEHFKWSDITYIYFNGDDINLCLYNRQNQVINALFLDKSKKDLGLLIYTYMKKVKDN